MTRAMCSRKVVDRNMTEQQMAMHGLKNCGQVSNSECN